jgi:hypothetical protein
MSDIHTGAYGTAERVPRVNYAADIPATLDWWIITAPTWTPHWSQYALSVVTLADTPGVPAATKKRDDVTHEVIVFALDPDYGPFVAADVTDRDVKPITPINIAEQITCTDARG